MYFMTCNITNGKQTTYVDCMVVKRSQLIENNYHPLHDLSRLLCQASLKRRQNQPLATPTNKAAYWIKLPLTITIPYADLL